MSVKLKVLSAGALFFLGGTLVSAQQSKKDSLGTRDIEEVVMVGYGTQKKSEVTATISKVKGSDMANLNTPSFEAQLAGRASGVQITQGSGELGAAPRVRIRGINSISSGTQPLYIVDGMAMISADQGAGYASANPLSDINPNDIESIEVLKDGAATAIYGSRAANGVILITTKKGKGGKFTFNYGNILSFAMPANYYKLLNTDQFLAITAEKTIAAGGVADSWASGNEFNTNWQKAVLRSTSQQDHYVSFGGGTAKGKYMASMGYTDQEGIIVNNSMKRYTIRLNTEQKLIDKVDVGANISFAKTYFSGLNNDSGATSGAIYNALKQLPNTPIYDPSTPTGYNIYTQGTTSLVGPWTNNAFIANNLTNIVYVLNNNIYKSNLTRISAGTFANVKFTNWLTYRLQVGVDNSITKGHLYYNKIHGDGFSARGVVRGTHQDLLRWTVQNIVTLNKSFGRHSFNTTLVHEFQNDRSEFITGGGNGLLGDFFGQAGPISGTYITQLSGGSVTENRLDSYVARLNYNYGKRYFLQASIRRDGLSRLPKSGRWGTFPGLSLGWTVSNESFMQSLKPVLSDLKFKASYAEVGNTELGGSYPYMSLYGAAKYAENTGLALVQAGNYMLSWEKSKKYDYGMELGLLNNRITLSADYFINNQDGLVLDRPTDPTYGIPGNIISQNIGVIRNQGLEIAVNADIIKTENFSWSMGANTTFMDNEVKELVNGQDIYTSTGSAVTGVIRVGESIRSLYGYRYWGVNKANGNPVYYKADGSLVQQNVVNGAFYVYNANNPADMGTRGSLTSDDKQVLGRTIPKYFGSVNTNFKWKNFDLSALVRFSGGNKIYNMTRREMLGMDFINNSTEILGRWQSVDNPGDGITPRVYAARTNQVNGDTSSRFVEDGSFIKVDNISLGYSLPKDFISSLGLSQFRVYATVQNAFVFTKYSGIDPEMESGGVDFNNIPRQKTYSIGLNVGF